MQHMIDEPAAAAEDPARPRRRRRLESAEEARSTRRSLARWGLSFVLGVLVVSSLVGESGYLATLRARKEERALLASVARVRLENQRLQQEADRLEQDPAALEEAARRQLGLIRPGETLIILHDSGPAADQAPAR
jgi:cell division protein FtsB